MIWKIALGVAIFVFIDAVVLPWFSRKLDRAELRLDPDGAARGDASEGSTR